MLVFSDSHALSDRSRVIVQIGAGIAAGVLGLTHLDGFAFMLFWGLVLSAVRAQPLAFLCDSPDLRKKSGRRGIKMLAADLILFLSRPYR